MLISFEITWNQTLLIFIAFVGTESDTEAAVSTATGSDVILKVWEKLV